MIAPELLRLDPHTESSLAFDLRELLAAIGEETGSRLFWRATSGPSSTEFVYHHDSRRRDALELWDRIDADRSGLALPWSELLDIGDSIFQTSWLTLLGFDSPRACQFDRLFADGGAYIDRVTPFFYQEVSIAIQCVDGSFWFVYAQEDALRERLRGMFPAVKPRDKR